VRFTEFMEQYRKNLTEANTLEDLLQEAKRNHRVQKLLPFYAMKDRATFDHMLRLADKDPFARKLVVHAQMTLETLGKNQSRTNPGMKKLLVQLTGLNTVALKRDHDVPMEEWESDGYQRVLNSYFLPKKVFSPLKVLYHRKKMDSVDWDNLVGQKH
jgi:hypothetical protein